MKILVYTAIMVSLLFVLVPATGCGSGFRTAEFPDEHLDAAMREILHFEEEDDIPIVRLEALTTLDLSGKGIADITGLEDCVNLVSLNLGGNKITDLNPLIRMSKLVSLNLRDNQIVTVLPLQALFELRILNLSANEIVDAADLVKCEKLNSLDLSDNTITDLEAWTGYRLATDQELTLDLTGNPLSDESVDTWIPMIEANGIMVLR